MTEQANTPDGTRKPARTAGSGMNRADFNELRKRFARSWKLKGQGVGADAKTPAEAVVATLRVLPQWSSQQVYHYILARLRAGAMVDGILERLWYGDPGKPPLVPPRPRPKRKR